MLVTQLKFKKHQTSKQNRDWEKFPPISEILSDVWPLFAASQQLFMEHYQLWCRCYSSQHLKLKGEHVLKISVLYFLCQWDYLSIHNMFRIKLPVGCSRSRKFGALHWQTVWASWWNVRIVYQNSFSETFNKFSKSFRNDFCIFSEKLQVAFQSFL